MRIKIISKNKNISDYSDVLKKFGYQSEPNRKASIEANKLGDLFTVCNSLNKDIIITEDLDGTQALQIQD